MPSASCSAWYFRDFLTYAVSDYVPQTTIDFLSELLDDRADQADVFADEVSHTINTMQDLRIAW